MRINEWKPYILRIADMLFAVIAMLLSELIFFGSFFENTTSFTIIAIGLAIQAVVYIFSLYVLNIYKIIWYYSTLQEMSKLIVALLFSQMVSYVIHIAVGLVMSNSFKPTDYLKVHAVAGVISIVFIVVFRVIIFCIERKINTVLFSASEDEANNTMIIGGGDACFLFIREMNLKHSDEYMVRCIIDDDHTKHRMLFDNVPVVGNRYSIEENVKKYKIKKIVFAIPSCPAEDKTEILSICAKTNCLVKTMPSIYQMVDGSDNNADYVKQIRNVEIEDLLGREPIRIDLDCVMNYVSGRVVMVTGGGGSIGSELCRQIAAYNPKQLIIFDIYFFQAFIS